jgi:hypothetical protein
MGPITLSPRSRSRLAAIFTFALALLLAACNNGGSSGY